MQNQVNKPRFEDFGITSEEYNKIAKGRNYWNTPLQIVAFAIALTASLISWFLTKDLDQSIVIVIPGFVFLSLCAGAISELLIRRSKSYKRVKLYREALERYSKKIEAYWVSLKGAELEYQIGELYKKLGYQIEHTSRTGDRGIDLILKKDNVTTIVQCKGYKKPVGPAIVRELFGTLSSSSADNAILVSPSGFTKGAIRTAISNDIKLVSSIDLVSIVDTLKG